jgi:hypothetical protein
MKIPPKTLFDEITIDAAKALARLRRLEGPTKLTAHAFMRKALETAGLTPEGLTALQTSLKASEAPHVAIDAFVRRCALEFRSPNWTSPPVDSAKVARIYGSDTLAAELHDFNVTTPWLVALAVARCVELFPDSFGDIADPHIHQMKLQEARDKLSSLYSQLGGSWTSQDVEVDPRIPVSLRDEGYARLRFHRHPQVFLIEGANWPEQLAQAEIDLIAAKAEPEAEPVESFEDADEAVSEDAPRKIRRRVPASLQAS